MFLVHDFGHFLIESITVNIIISIEVEKPKIILTHRYLQRKININFLLDIS
jgi:hypothetical protein